METKLIINTPAGTCTLNKRGKKGIYQFSISFNENLGRYRASTGTARKDRLEATVRRLVQEEYDRRLAGLAGASKITPEHYILTIHIPQLDSEIGVPLDNKPEIIRTERKTKTDIHLLQKYFVPFVRRKRWEQLQTTSSGRDLVFYLRKLGIKEQTIRNYLGIYNRFLRYAEIDRHISMFPTYPAISKGKKKKGMYIDGYASATTSMIDDLDTIFREVIEQTKHMGRKRAYLLGHQYFLLLADTGIRPYTNPPFTWKDIKDVGDYIQIYRDEKNIQYYAQGGSRTREVLRTLQQLYLKEGVNVKGTNLPIFKHKNSPEQIIRLNETLNSILKLAGWYDNEDELGRKYRAYSIRKWHINQSLLTEERGEDVAFRVGHSYDTLRKYYMDTERRQFVKGDVWLRAQRNNSNSKRTS